MQDVQLKQNSQKILIVNSHKNYDSKIRLK
jgi:hypothetical protein